MKPTIYSNVTPTPLGDLKIEWLKDSFLQVFLGPNTWGNMLLRTLIEKESAELAEALESYILEGVNCLASEGKSLEQVKRYIAAPVNYYQVPAGLNQYLQGTATFKEKAVALWGFSLWEQPEKFIKQRVAEHLKNVPAPVDYETALLYFLPQYSFLPLQDALFLKDIVGTAKAYKLFTEPEGLQIAKAGFAIEKGYKLKEGGETTIAEWKHYIYPDRTSRHLEFAKLPLHTKKYRDYVLQLPANDFQKLIGKIPPSSSADAAIELSEKIFENKKINKTELINSATQEFAKVTPVLAQYENTYLMQTLYNSIMTSCTKENRVKLVMGYLQTLSEEQSPSENHLLENVNCIINPRWVKPFDMADIVIEKLLEVTTPAVAAKSVIAASQENQSLTVKQWELYINGIDIYQDLPVGWWLPFVKRVASD